MKYLFVIMLGFIFINLNASKNEVCLNDKDNFVLVSQNKNSQNDNDKLIYIAVKNGEVFESRTYQKRDSLDFIQGITKSFPSKWKIGKAIGMNKLNIIGDQPEYQIYKNGNIKLRGHYSLSIEEQKLIHTKEHSYVFKGVSFELCL